MVPLASTPASREDGTMSTSSEPDLSRLNDRERQVLRLLARGHDGKSAARALGISPTAVHERLREALSKLGVASSREAARLLAAAEGPDSPADEESGIGAGADPLSPGHSGQRRLAVIGLGGLVVVGIVVGMLALWMTSTIGESIHVQTPVTRTR